MILHSNRPKNFRVRAKVAKIKALSPELGYFQSYYKPINTRQKMGIFTQYFVIWKIISKFAEKVFFMNRHGTIIRAIFHQ